MSDTDVAWGVFVRLPDMTRGEWLAPDGYLTKKRVFASLNWGDVGRARCEVVASQIAEENPSAFVEARQF